MALSTTEYTTRNLSLLLLAALAGMGLWLFAPFSFDGGSPSGGETTPSQLPAMLQIDGEVIASTQGSEVTSITIPISLRGADSVDLTNAGLRAETALSESALAAVPADFSIEWTSGNGDSILESGEAAIVSVTVPANSSVYEHNPLDLVFSPAEGSTLVIKDVLRR